MVFPHTNSGWEIYHQFLPYVPFGCKSTLAIPKKTQDKLSSHSSTGFHLGLAIGKKALIIYNLPPEGSTNPAISTSLKEHWSLDWSSWCWFTITHCWDDQVGWWKWRWWWWWRRRSCSDKWMVIPSYWAVMFQMWMKGMCPRCYVISQSSRAAIWSRIMETWYVGCSTEDGPERSMVWRPRTYMLA